MSKQAAQGPDSLAERSAPQGATPAAEPLDFLVFGDSQSLNTIYEGFVERVAALESPAFFVVLGDLVERGDQRERFEHWERLTAPLRSGAAVYPVIGNHEYWPGNRVGAFGAFFGATTGGRHFYSVDHPPLRLIILDSHYGEPDVSPGRMRGIGLWDDAAPANPAGHRSRDQVAWLEDQLRDARARCLVPFVFSHVPCFGQSDISFAIDDTWGVRETPAGVAEGNLVPLLRKHGVASMWSGHVHLYERHVYEGIQFVTTGLTSYVPWELCEATASRFRVAAADDYHYCRVRVNGATAQVEAIALADRDGRFHASPRTIDSFSIRMAPGGWPSSLGGRRKGDGLPRLAGQVGARDGG